MKGPSENESSSETLKETATDASRPSSFLRQQIDKDLADGRVTEVVTRFPPEPNGYLHIGHAKSICLNFGLAQHFGGRCRLRFDDTNPEKENQEYIDAIKQDVEWLGYEWAGDVRYASDYFDALYEFAEELLTRDKAYVCALTADEMAEYRGSLKEPGRNSPYRDRPVEESLQLFRDMRDGKYQNGELVLRAKIDMASPNINLRDPILYRIRYADHHQTGSKWCIYPMYDFAHCLSDALEGITHSICTLEFENNRELYDWVLANAPVEHVSHQYEMARLSVTHTVLSKRWLRQLVEEKRVHGWDDPRMPTISGMRRRGITPEALRTFVNGVGVTKNNTTIDIDDDGTVTIAAINQEDGDLAKKRIEDLTAEVEVGTIYEGKVVKIMDFGAFVNLLPGQDGMVHISEICHERVAKVTDKMSEGDIVRVKVLEVDKQGRVRLSMKALLDKPE